MWAMAYDVLCPGNVKGYIGLLFLLQFSWISGVLVFRNNSETTCPLKQSEDFHQSGPTFIQRPFFLRAKTQRRETMTQTPHMSQSGLKLVIRFPAVQIRKRFRSCFLSLLFPYALEALQSVLVGIPTDYGLDDRGSSASRGKTFFSTLHSQDRLWGPPSFLSNGYRGLFPRVRAAGA
jgi:hypothetical protein